MSILEIKNIKKSFGEDLEVLQDISLAVEEGEVVSILGPSGSGKSTLLRRLIPEALRTAGKFMWKMIPQEMPKNRSAQRFWRHSQTLAWFFRTLICSRIFPY